jgi:hypothetical protein
VPGGIQSLTPMDAAAFPVGKEKKLKTSKVVLFEISSDRHRPKVNNKNFSDEKTVTKYHNTNTVIGKKIIKRKVQSQRLSDKMSEEQN